MEDDVDRLVVEDPRTDAYTLSIVAARRSDLWPQILTHPNTDATWKEEIRGDLTARGIPVPPEPAEPEPMDPETPDPEPAGPKASEPGPTDGDEAARAWPWRRVFRRTRS